MEVTSDNDKSAINLIADCRTETAGLHLKTTRSAPGRMCSRNVLASEAAHAKLWHALH